ncbi:MAG: 50S ribosomal protein L32 [Eubacteriales bacterium]|nr:50S ribosomal protein L32 [Bacillota bacterium]MBV1726620.1 50S ribosomal protein L32 [Desulforudis sp.]MDQ7789149.1 50S ribosomal protein L32 [Clostridia bacterium]MDZ4042841.1 50S ribosomal protein L32 [Eubacteriales bacterium]MBV1734864.1 50S ribosomal protein L32 [Desulforudis sp.]
MGVPKRRHSKQRGRKRRAQWKIEAPKLIPCSQCRALTLSHRVCPECGFYKAKKVVNIEK